MQVPVAQRGDPSLDRSRTRSIQLGSADQQPGRDTVAMNAGVFSGSYKWRLNDISKTKEKEISSPAFYVGSYRWCISFFPQGDEDTPLPDSIRLDIGGWRNR